MRKEAKRFFLGNLAVAGVCLAAAEGTRRLIRWREKVMPRRDPRLPFREILLRSEDGTAIAVRVIDGGGGGAVVLAHPAVTGQRYAPLVDLAEMLAAHFTVYTFDFRGHGGSGGRLEMDLSGPVKDLRAVVWHARESGHKWVAAVGFSLGGMAALVHSALYPGLDAVAAVGAPPTFPDVGPFRVFLPVWSLFLRFLGARFRAVPGSGPLPLEVAGEIPPISLLIVHGENEVFYRRDDMEEMLRRLRVRADFWEIPGAGHTELAGREGDLVAWLVKKAGKRERP